MKLVLQMWYPDDSVVISRLLSVLLSSGWWIENLPTTVDRDKAMKIIVTGKITAGMRSIYLIQARQNLFRPTHHLIQNKMNQCLNYNKF